MNVRTWASAIAAAIALLCVVASDAPSQAAATNRQGLVVAGALGWGAAHPDCCGPDGGRGRGAWIGAGWGVTSRLTLSLEAGNWWHAEWDDHMRWNAVVVTVYPAQTSGAFVSAGLSDVSASLGQMLERTTTSGGLVQTFWALDGDAPAPLLRAGWEIRAGRRLFIVPVVTAMRAGTFTARQLDGSGAETGRADTQIAIFQLSIGVAWRRGR